MTPLYLATAACLAFMMLYAANSISQAARPTADVEARYEKIHSRIWVAAFQPGDVSTMVIDQVPVIVWRRNTEEIAKAKTQDVEGDRPNPMSFISGTKGKQVAHDINLSTGHEWFFVSALNPDGHGCLVTARKGDVGGFFDPCRGAHFDLSGRIRKGPAIENLRVISATLSPDGSFFQLDLSGLEKIGN